MKRVLLTMMLVAIAALSINAASKYEINVAGVEVTSSNCNNVTGGDILGGTVKYDPTSNTLTLTNVTISRSGGSNYGIHNRDCAGLKMKFVGTCNISCTTANAIHLDKTTTIEITSSSTLNAKMTAGENYGRGVIYVNGSAGASFLGPGTLNVSGQMKSGGSTSSCATCGFEGKGKSNSCYVAISDDLNVVMNVTHDGFYKFDYVHIYTGDVKINFNYGFRALDQIGELNLWNDMACVTPADATFNANSGYFGGNDYYTHFTNDYGEIITTEKFPDANFRSSLRSLVSPEEYFTKAQL
ncbi:MAG: hypothetical protein J6S96_04370, partial [Muribaculaceae bacterium]|nr:hypothetical protein [Muribaculaceae bacterium]